MKRDGSPDGCLLHVFLLTYNRQKSLRRTLEAIAASPLKDHPLTVMDNCSTDETGAVCEEYRKALPQMEVVRHERNIGFGANYLRALERSEGEYTWVLCDDDTLYPERVGALLEMLREQRPEACFVGGPRQEEWPAGLNVLPSEIQRKCGTFTTGPSFVPALVFKSGLIGSRELLGGYFAIRTNYPQMEIGRKLLVEDIPCAVLRPPVLTRDEPTEKGATPLEVIVGWSFYCRTLPAKLRKEGFYSVFGRPTMTGMVREVLRMVVWTKIDGGSTPSYDLALIGLNTGWEVRIGLTVCRLACLVPGRVYHVARECYRKVKYGWLGRPLPPTYHVPVGQDELRR